MTNPKQYPLSVGVLWPISGACWTKEHGKCKHDPSPLLIPETITSATAEYAEKNGRCMCACHVKP
jgi:hypothetical protein